MQRGTYVAPVSHYEGEEDDGGWTTIDKKTKEVQARLAKKKQQKKAETAGQKQAAEIKKEATLDTTTMFSTFQELMDRKEQEKQAAEAKKAAAQQKKAKDAPPPLPAAEAVAPKLDADDLQQRIDLWKNKYTDKSIQLKCLADYFFEKLGELSYESPEKALPFTKDFLGACNNFLSSVSDEASPFLEFLISTHLAHLEKKRRGCGIFPLLQVTLSLYAHHIVDSIDTIKSKCCLSKSSMGPVLDKVNAPNVIALITEIKRVNSRAALHCWLELILPTLISIKDMQLRSQYIGLLEAIVAEKFKADKGTYAAADSLILFINLFYSDKLHKSHRARVEAIFQKVLNANVFFNDRSPHLFFQSLLALCSEEGPNPDFTAARKQTIFELLTKSLTQDLKCGKHWKSIYPYYVPQSNNLLVYIDSHWKAGTGGVVELTKAPKRNAFHRDLLQIIKSFDDQNNTLTTDGAIDGDEEQTMKALGLTDEILGITTATLHQIERTMGTAPVLQADGTDGPDPNASGSGFGRVFLTLCFLLLIYFVYVKGIEFSDVKLFLKEGQTKLGL